jgi:hypothetical protein
VTYEALEQRKMCCHDTKLYNLPYKQLDNELVLKRVTKFTVVPDVACCAVRRAFKLLNNCDGSAKKL